MIHKRFLYGVLIVLVFSAGCSWMKKTTGEYRPADNTKTGKTEDKAAAITPSAAVRAWNDFSRCMENVLSEIAVNTFRGVDDMNHPGKVAGNCYTSYREAMHDNTSITPEVILNELQLAHQRQKNMLEDLRQISRELNTGNVSFQVLEPGSKKANLLWETGSEPSIPVQTSNGVLFFAVPLCPATTGSYLSLSQNAAAAQIIYLNQNMILFLEPSKDPGITFSTAWQKILPEPVNITSLIPGCWNSMLYENKFMIIDSDKEYNTDELQSLMDRFSVQAIVVTNSGTFTGYIFPGKEYKIPLADLEEKR